MDEVFDVLFFSVTAAFMFIIIVGISGGFDPTAYCADGQARVYNDGEVTSCLILPPPVPPGYVLPPGVPAPGPVVVPPMYK